VKRAFTILHVSLGRTIRLGWAARLRPATCLWLPTRVRPNRTKTLPILDRPNRTRRDHPDTLLVKARSLGLQRVELRTSQWPTTIFANGCLLAIKRHRGWRRRRTRHNRAIYESRGRATHIHIRPMAENALPRRGNRRPCPVGTEPRKLIGRYTHRASSDRTARYEDVP